VAGLSEIPCIIIKAGEKSSAQLAITENLQRCDLDIFEEAQALERLLSAANMTQSQLALELCMSQSAVANKLRLLRLDENTRQIVRKHGLSERHARALLRVPPKNEVTPPKRLARTA
jgi:ParB family chromosome partitioning protein